MRSTLQRDKLTGLYFCIRTTSTPCTHLIKAPTLLTPQYDPGAVYEAIVNAVAHRNYGVYGAKVRIHLFSDRLEIMTPGGLPNSLTGNLNTNRRMRREPS